MTDRALQGAYHYALSRAVRIFLSLLDQVFYQPPLTLIVKLYFHEV